MTFQNKIGIIGYGVIGKALASACEDAGDSVYVYDKYMEHYCDITKIIDTDCCFVCTPTPTFKNLLGKHQQDISSLIDVLTSLDNIAYENPVCIRCTVIPGTMDMLSKQFPDLHLLHMPEFITERNSTSDLKNQTVMYISGDSLDCSRVSKMFPVSMSVRHASDYKVTEHLKYMHNCFLATKVAIFNDFYKAVGNKETYDRVIEMLHEFGNIGPSHLQVPGPDQKFGFGGMCFPKDTTAYAEHFDLQLLHEVIEFNRLLRNED